MAPYVGPVSQTGTLGNALVGPLVRGVDPGPPILTRQPFQNPTAGAASVLRAQALAIAAQAAAMQATQQAMGVQPDPLPSAVQAQVTTAQLETALAEQRRTGMVVLGGIAVASVLVIGWAMYRAGSGRRR